VAINESAVKVLGDAQLRAIARELTAVIKKNITIDWAVRENVRARIRTLVRRTLRRHGYLPDNRENATLTVLEAF
jgi:type I restriction enzyme, R subunit